jgi:hypothetical protein
MNDTERHEIEMLLPWHATGKLSAEEKRRVDGALARDAGLRRQSELIGQELAQTVTSNEALMPPRSLDADKLMAMLARESKSPAAVASSWFARLKDTFNGPARVPLRWATVAAALLLVVQGGAVAILVAQRETGRYQTAGDLNGTQAPGTYVLARLNDAASIADIGKALQQRSISIVDGPKADGFYTLRVGGAEMSIAERDAKISDLRSLTGLVVFVAPLK